MEKKKTEGGQQYPVHAFLLAPDPEAPATWKFRIWEPLAENHLALSAPQLTRAAGRLSRAQLSEAERTTALAALKAGVAALGQTTLQEASLYNSYVAATKGSVASYETVLAAVASAVRARNHEGEPYPSCTPVATFDGSVVYEHDGHLYEVSYAIVNGEIQLGDDEQEVVANFKPVTTPLREARETDLLEFRPSGALKDARIDAAAGVIYGTVLINADSANGGGGGGRTYSEKALKQIASMSEGLPAFANHVTDKAKAFQPRPIQDAIGRHRNVRYDPTLKRVTSDLHILENQRDWVMPIAKDFGDVMGNSLVSRGYVRTEGNKEIVEEILAVRSGDLVSDPATTRGLFEHREARPSPTPKEGLTMTLKEWAATGSRTRTPAPAPRTPTLTEGMDSKDRRIAALTEENAALQVKVDGQVRTLSEATAKLDALASAQKTRDREERLSKALLESDLTKKHGKNDHAITPAFRKLLAESDEAKWKELIADRVATFDSVKPAAPRLPESHGKPLAESRDGIPEGAAARLRAALVG